MIKLEKIGFTCDHPIRKSLFPKGIESNKPLSEVLIMAMSHTFLLKAGVAGVLPVTSDGYILEESTPYSDYIRSMEKNPEFFQTVKNEIDKIDLNSIRKGKYISLTGLWCASFYHWMMENIIKAIISMQAGFDGYYIIPNMRFAWESLELLGISKEKIIPYDGKPWLLETLYIPQPINGPIELKKYPALIQMTRDKFLQAVGNSDSTSERIYVPRPYPPNLLRRVVNEHELSEIIDKYKFRRIVMEDLTLKEQIRIASTAKCIIGPHGAGMVHTLFMPPESLVVELFSPTYINPCMLPVIDYLNHRYYMIPSIKNRDYKYGEDIEANISVIEVTLKRELK